MEQLKQQDLLFSRCFASEAPQSTPTLLAKVLAPRQTDESEGIAANARKQAALLPGVLCRLLAGTDVPDSLYSQFDHPLNMAIRAFEEECVPLIDRRMFTQRHSPDDIVWTLLCIFRILPRSREELLKLELLLLSRLKDGGPKAAAELVAAFAAPESQFAFAAILTAGWALADPALAEALLAAGVAPALVTAIGRAESFCQDAAIVTACHGARSPVTKVLQELRRAGLARSLARVVCRDFPDLEQDLQNPVPATFVVFLPIWGDVHDPTATVKSNPSHTACAAAVEVIAVAPDFAPEVAECLAASEGPWWIFAHARQDPHPPAHLVSSILGALQEGAVKDALIARILGGVPKDDVAAVFQVLMRPQCSIAFMTRNALLEFGKVFDDLQGCKGWARERAQAVVGVGLVEYIEATPYVGSGEDDPPVDVAVRMLSKLVARHEEGRYVLMGRIVGPAASPKLVGNLVRVMASDDAALALRALSLVLDCIRLKKLDPTQDSKAQEGLMRAAVKGGFIPHLIRLLQMSPSAYALAGSPDSPPLADASVAVTVLQEGLRLLSLFDNFSFLEEAVRHGLLDLIKAAMCGSHPSRFMFGVICIRMLLVWEDKLFPLLHDAGVWPQALVEAVERAGSSDSKIVEIAAYLAHDLTTKSKWAKILGALLAGGFLKKLRAALARVSSGPVVPGEEALILVGWYIKALETWAESNWQSIAQFMPLGTGTGSGASKKPKKDLKKLVLKQVLEPEEAGTLALVAPRPRGSQPQSSHSATTTPSADRPANARVPGGTAAAAEVGTARQGSPGQASAHTAPNPGPSRESECCDASAAGRSTRSPRPGHKKAADACVQCGAVKGVDGTKLQECAACRSVRYCGRECQRSHWHVHKPVCRAMQKERV